MVSGMIDFTSLWDKAYTFDAFLAASTKRRGLWEGIHRLARVIADAAKKVEALQRRRRES